MKVFNNFEDAFNSVGKVVQAGCKDATRIIAEQVYKDSEKFTYYDTHDLYKSGALYSKFEDGIITERTPYARKLYYEGANPRKNKSAVPKWFEHTCRTHKKDYIRMGGAALDNAKKGNL